MTTPDPIFFDQHGAQPDSEPGGGTGLVAVLRGGLAGREPLWKVFWFFFLAGHGVIIGVGGGVMIFAMVGGLAFDSVSLSSGAWGLAFGGVLTGVVLLAFALWCVVALWRCAYNCHGRRWGHAARVLSLFYGGVWVYTLSSIWK